MASNHCFFRNSIKGFSYCFLISCVNAVSFCKCLLGNFCHIKHSLIQCIDIQTKIITRSSHFFKTIVFFYPIQVQIAPVHLSTNKSTIFDIIDLFSKLFHSGLLPSHLYCSISKSTTHVLLLPHKQRLLDNTRVTKSSHNNLECFIRFVSQQTISWETKQNETLRIVGRHDPCIVPRAVPCVEAAIAIALLDLDMLQYK